VRTMNVMAETDMTDTNVADADMAHADTHAATTHADAATTHAHRMATAHSAAAEAAATAAARVGRAGRDNEAGCAKGCDRSDGEHRGTDLGEHGSLLGLFALGRNLIVRSLVAAHC
jgi:hypothetical protein